MIWAKDVADGQVKGFIVANDTPGFSTTKLEDKIALRIVQNAVITLEDVRVDEADRLANANSFRDTAEVLRMTRAGVAWMAVGCARGAYENALAYATSREQFGRPIAGFQLVQDLLVRMLGNITSSWALCARLSQLQDEGCAEDRHSSLAKAWCTVGCAKPSATLANCSAATEFSWSTTSDGSSLTPKPSTPTKAPAR